MMGKFPENPETTPSEGGGPLTRGFSGPHVPILGIFGGSRQFKVGVGKFSGITDGEFVEIGVGKKTVGVAECFPDSGFSPTQAGRALKMGVGMFGMDACADVVARGGSEEKHGIPGGGKLVFGTSFPFWGFPVGSKPASKTTSPLPIIQNTTSQGGIDGKGSLALCP